MDNRPRKCRRNRRRDGEKAKKFKEMKEAKQKQGYDDIVRYNANFEKYYKIQKIVPDDEWDAFIAALKENLPTAFRITGSKNHAKALLKIIRSEYFDQLVNANEESEKPICLSWYPENLAWQLNLSRKSIRKDETFSKLHNFLVHETNSGNISRQEVVSMIPPLLLDVQPHHYVLDMCAAPGSKTAQLIEMLHANDTVLPQGMLVANDVDNRRCYMLVHQAKRLQSPCFLITNHDASSMPNIRMIDIDGSRQSLKYDRILCDVPCSGDGTLRKNYDVWMKWNAANGNNLHGLQLRIAKRGLEMLAVGGQLVYSTCSFNPIENEAVVHNLLKQCEGSVELVDVSDKLPGLKYRPGLSYWKVTNKHLEVYENFETVPEQYLTQVRPHMFPPTPEEAEKYPLHKCVRILPHDQNTGGFFVAVLKKTALIPGEKIKKIDPSTDQPKEIVSAVNDEAKVDEINTEESTENPPPRKKIKIYGFREDPFYFFKDDKTVWPSIQQFYKIEPTFDSNCLLTRCDTGKKRNIYLVTKVVKDVISNNQDRIKVINTGVKLFSRNDSKGINSCSFRLTQEGLQTVLPFTNARHVKITRDDLILLLTTEFPFNNKMSQETRQQLSTLETGCIVLLYQLENCDDDEPLTVALCGWKGATSTRAYVPKGDRIHYLRLCGADISKYEKKSYTSNDQGNDETDEPSVSIEDATDEKLLENEVKDGEGSLENV